MAGPVWSVASSPLDPVRRARALLGAETWARIVQVENTNPRSVYPPTVYGLVFELGGLLWFYTDTDGTQSFSMHRNNLAVEKADFAPLLRDIDPGFARHTIIEESPGATMRATDKVSLPNGCLIESYAALRERAASGEPILRARLLSYYVRGRRAGHTVLAYETSAGLHVIDPAVSKQPRKVKQPPSDDALVLARKIERRLAIAEARWLPTLSALESPLLAAIERSAKSATAANGPDLGSSREMAHSSGVAGS